MSKAGKIAQQIPKEIRSLLGQPPIIGGESKATYWLMVQKFAHFISSEDFIAWLLVKDLADYRMEIQRLRRYRAILIDHSWDREKARLEARLREQIDYGRAKYAAEIERRKTEILNSGKLPDQVIKLIADAEAQLEIERIRAEEKARDDIADWAATENKEEYKAILYQAWLPSVEALEPLLASAEGKFSDKLMELERHISGFANLIREAAYVDAATTVTVGEKPHPSQKKILKFGKGNSVQHSTSQSPPQSSAG